MKRGYPCLILMLLGCAALSHWAMSSGAASPSQARQPEQSALTSGKGAAIQIGIISYWLLSNPGWRCVPPNTVLLINPRNGILQKGSNEPVETWKEWLALVKELKGKKVEVLGYVPTGYFDRSASCEDKDNKRCEPEERIRLQVKTYYELIPELDGIFYDETSPKEGISPDFEKEYSLLRSINKENKATGLTVFNVGAPEKKAVAAASSGEHVVLFESSPGEFKNQKAKIAAAISEAKRKEGGPVKVWLLVHSVSDKKKMRSHVTEMAALGADYGYVTNLSGDWKKVNTWVSLPPYWEEELKAFSAASEPCPKK
jgi:hypothetical protein